MGELIQSVPDGQSAIALISHRRLLRDMAAVVAAGTVIGLMVVSGSFAIGFVVGGLLSFANYFWLKRSIEKLFERAGDGTSSTLLAMVYIFRYVLLGSVLYVVYLTGAFPVVAVILGLGSFAVAVTIEGLFNIFSTFNKKEF